VISSVCTWITVLGFMVQGSVLSVERVALRDSDEGFGILDSGFDALLCLGIQGFG
jgi:hypothetical protein